MSTYNTYSFKISAPRRRRPNSFHIRSYAVPKTDASRIIFKYNYKTNDFDMGDFNPALT